MFCDTSSLSLSPSIYQKSAENPSLQLAFLRSSLQRQAFLPNLSVPSILLLTQTTVSTRIAGAAPTSLPYNASHSPALLSRLVQKSSPTPLRLTANKSDSRLFPSPLFCSSPTQAVPVCPITPRASPRCPSPIQSTPSPSRSELLNSLHSQGPVYLQRTGHVLEHRGFAEDNREIVRIVGRRLFEEEDDDDEEKTLDKIGLLTFIMDTECSKMSEEVTASSFSSSFRTTLPTRLIDATQASMQAKFPLLSQEERTSHGDEGEVMLSASYASLLAKYPNLFSSITGSGEQNVHKIRTSCQRDSTEAPVAVNKRKRASGQSTIHDIHESKKKVCSKKRKVKSLISTVMVSIKHKKNRTNRDLITNNCGINTRSLLRAKV